MHHYFLKSEGKMELARKALADHKSHPRH
jgi:hypothetical protein